MDGMIDHLAEEFAKHLFTQGFIEGKDQEAVAEEAAKWFALMGLRIIGELGNG